MEVDDEIAHAVPDEPADGAAGERLAVDRRRRLGARERERLQAGAEPAREQPRAVGLPTASPRPLRVR